MTNLAHDTVETLNNTLAKPNKLHDLGTVAKNTWQTVSQDGDELSVSAAFWATLIHVVLRVMQAQYSAQQPGPPAEVAYRKRESAKTFFREVVGVTLGWGVIKTVGKVVKAQLLKAYGYEQQKPGVTPLGKGIGQAIAVLKGELSNVPAGPVAITGEAHLVKVGDKAHEGLRRGGAILHAWSRSLAPDKQHLPMPSLVELEKTGFKFVHGYLPVALGAALAIPISGWWLERTTLLHGEAMIDKLMELTHKDEAKKAKPASPVASPVGVRQPAIIGQLKATPLMSPSPSLSSPMARL
jgi:hypothetical protein